MKVQDHFLTKEEFEIKETAVPGVFKTHPIPRNIARYYDSKEYISHHQDSGTLKEKLYKFLQNFNLKYKRNILFDFVGKNKRVLDYGCGAGEFIKYVENDIEQLQIQKNELRKILENEVSKINEENKISNFQIEEIFIKPKRSDIYNIKLEILWKEE